MPIFTSQSPSNANPPDQLSALLAGLGFDPSSGHDPGADAYSQLPSNLQAGGAQFGVPSTGATQPGGVEGAAGAAGAGGPLDPVLGRSQPQTLPPSSGGDGGSADADASAYANLPSVQQAGGLNLGALGAPTASAPDSSALFALLGTPQGANADANAYAALPSDQQAGGANFGLGGLSRSVASAPGQGQPQGSNGPLAPLLNRGAGVQPPVQMGGAGQDSGSPASAPSAVQPQGYGGLVPLPALPVRKPIGPLEAIFDVATGGFPAFVRNANYRAQVDNYNNAVLQNSNVLAARSALMKMQALQAAIAAGQAGSGNAAPDQSSGPPAGVPDFGPPRRNALATYALVDDKPADAATILQSDVAQGTDGWLYDKKTGARLSRIPDHTVVNGQNTDLGDPQNPQRFYPQFESGTQPVYDQFGNPVGAMPVPGAVGAAAKKAGATADATNASEARYASRKAFGTAAGTGAGGALTDIVQVPDGRGGSVGMTRAQYLAGLQGFGLATVGAGGPNGQAGASSGRLGYTPNPAEQTFDKGQADAANSQLNSDMDARAGALQDLNSANTGLSYLQTHRGTAATGRFVAGANYLRALPSSVLQAAGINPQITDRIANDASTYQRLASQNLLSFSKTNLPSRYTEREMAVAGKVIPQLTTPNDAATYHWGLQAALANKTLQRAQFAANYQGPRSLQAIEQAWNASPQGRASLFADPVWKNAQLGGKPAVVYVQKGGQTYGIIGSGTGAPTSFLASGQ